MKMIPFKKAMFLATIFRVEKMVLIREDILTQIAS